MADGLGGVELGVAGLVAGGKGIDERLAAAYPTVQAVQRHMGLAARKVQQRQLRLRITLNRKFCIHSFILLIHLYTYTLEMVKFFAYLRAQVREWFQKTGVSGVCVSPLASPLRRLSISAVLRRTTM